MQVQYQAGLAASIKPKVRGFITGKFMFCLEVQVRRLEPYTGEQAVSGPGVLSCVLCSPIILKLSLQFTLLIQISYDILPLQVLVDGEMVNSSEK